MIAIDTNILVYAHRRDSPFHSAAKAAVTSLAEGRESWGLPWPCLHEFVAIVTHPRIYAPPSSLDQAVGQVDSWLQSPGVVLLGEAGEYWVMLRSVVMSARVVGPRIHDARIAALCRHHGVRELWSADRDFSRFTGLTIRNPLVEG